MVYSQTLQRMKIDPKRVAVVIPAYNEGEVLDRTLTPLVHDGYRIIVVDDGSGIGAAEQIRVRPVTVIRHGINLGQGAALQTGMEYALKTGAEVVVHFDADGQHNSGQIPELAAPILEGRADVTLGSRFLRAADRREVPFRKRLVLRIGRVISGLLTHVWLSDTHNGFRALSRDAAGRIRLRENGFAHATEILEEIRRHQLRVLEIPTTIKYSAYSEAKGQSIWNGLGIVVDLIARKILR